MVLELIQLHKFQKLFGNNGVIFMELLQWDKFLMED